MNEPIPRLNMPQTPSCTTLVTGGTGYIGSLSSDNYFGRLTTTILAGCP